MANKKAASYRLSPDALVLISKLAEHLGLSQAAVIEMAARELARKHKLAVRVASSE